MAKKADIVALLRAELAELDEQRTVVAATLKLYSQDSDDPVTALRTRAKEPAITRRRKGRTWTHRRIPITDFAKAMSEPLTVQQIVSRLAVPGSSRREKKAWGCAIYKAAADGFLHFENGLIWGITK